jgi:hypothetical protein
MAKIEVTFSGRIPKYFFGSLNEKYRKELKDAIQFCKDEVENESVFLEKIFSLSLVGLNNPREELYNVICTEDLQKLPHFNKLVNEFIENGGSNFEMIDRLFDYTNMHTYGSKYGISFFEDDAYIKVTNTETDEAIVEERKLADFASSAKETFCSEEVEEAHEDLLRLNDFRTQNTDFGFDPEDSYFSWYKNELGATFLSTNLLYPELEKFTNENPIEEQVTIYFDDITNWTFIIDTEDEEFDFKQLIFVHYPGAEEFRNSSSEIIFSHLFYKNELIHPDENWIRDKGITLMYGASRGLERLDFLLHG